MAKDTFVYAPSWVAMGSPMLKGDSVQIQDIRPAQVEMTPAEHALMKLLVASLCVDPNTILDEEYREIFRQAVTEAKQTLAPWFKKPIEVEEKESAIQKELDQAMETKRALQTHLANTIDERMELEKQLTELRSTYKGMYVPPEEVKKSLLKRMYGGKVTY